MDAGLASFVAPILGSSQEIGLGLFLLCPKLGG